MEDEEKRGESSGVGGVEDHKVKRTYCIYSILQLAIISLAGNRVITGITAHSTALNRENRNSVGRRK